METLKIALTANNAEDLILRITAELHKRGFEIKSFMYEAKSEDTAQIGITAIGEIAKKDQIIRQLSRLYDIKKADLAVC